MSRRACGGVHTAVDVFVLLLGSSRVHSTSSWSADGVPSASTSSTGTKLLSDQPAPRPDHPQRRRLRPARSTHSSDPTVGAREPGSALTAPVAHTSSAWGCGRRRRSAPPIDHSPVLLRAPGPRNLRVGEARWGQLTHPSCRKPTPTARSRRRAPLRRPRPLPPQLHDRAHDLPPPPLPPAARPATNRVWSWYTSPPRCPPCASRTHSPRREISSPCAPRARTAVADRALMMQHKLHAATQPRFRVASRCPPRRTVSSQSRTWVVGHSFSSISEKVSTRICCDSSRDRSISRSP